MRANIVLPADKIITLKWLNSNPGTIFVFGDNLLRKGMNGSAKLRNHPQSYGFITKKIPSLCDESYFRPDEYVGVFNEELQKVEHVIQNNPDMWYIFAQIGGGLANKYFIFEKVIEPEIRSLANRHENVILLF